MTSPTSAVLVERLRERLVLDDRHAVLARALADALRPCGPRPWPGRSGAAISSRRYSSATAKWVGLVMTTVAFLTSLEHPAARHLALDAADAALDLGVAFAAAALRRCTSCLRHLQRLHQPVALQAVVGERERRERPRRPARAASRRASSRRAPASIGRQPRQLRRVGAISRSIAVHAEPDDDGDGDQRLERVEPDCESANRLMPVGRAQARPVQLQRLGRERPSRPGIRACRRRQSSSPAQSGRRAIASACAPVATIAAQLAGGDRRAADASPKCARSVRQLARRGRSIRRSPKRRERDRRRHRRRRQRQVAAARDLPLLARVLQLLGCGFFCAFLVAIGLPERRAPSRMASMSDGLGRASCVTPGTVADERAPARTGRPPGGPGRRSP